MLACIGAENHHRIADPACVVGILAGEVEPVGILLAVAVRIVVREGGNDFFEFIDGCRRL
ncbi:hypothetical protein D3C87_2203320 [compost metagenome]